MSATNCTQPTDLTTFFSDCPARIPDFLLAVLAVTNGFRSRVNDLFVDNVVLCFRGQSFCRPEAFVRTAENLHRIMLQEDRPLLAA